MDRARILGIGQTSACGEGVGALRAALLSDRSPESRRSVSDPDSTAPLLAGDEGLEALVDPRLVRRVDRFSRRFLLSALLARADLLAAGEDPERTGVIVATGYGPLTTSFAFLDGIIEKGDELGSPFLFSSSVHNAPGSVISAVLGYQGPCLTVTAFAHAFAKAVHVAFAWLRGGRVDRVLVVAGDEYHELVGYGLRTLAIRPADTRLRPLDFSACSWVPGETFVALFLGREDAEPSAWGWLAEPRFMRIPGADPALRHAGPCFLSAKGERSSGDAYRDAARRFDAVACYTSLWGANPTCDAMTVAAAAISRKDGVIYPTPFPGDAESDTAVLPGGPLAPGSSIACVACDLPGEAALMEVI